MNKNCLIITIVVAVVILGIVAACMTGRRRGCVKTDAFKGVPKYNLVIVAIFKNEAVAMREWLEHYIKEGVEHFYMIDNGSTDDWKSQVTGAPVTIHTDKQKHQQKNHYNNYFLDEVKRNSKWVMVVDLDEFMYARKGFDTISEYLDSVDENIGQICVKWKMFGSNGHIKQPKSIIKDFTKRLNYDNPINNSFNNHKSICRTSNLIEMSVHSCKQNLDEIYVIDSGPNISEVILDDSPLHLNHYAIQSWEWFRDIKMTRGDVSSQGSVGVRNKEYFDKYDVNEILDTELRDKR